MLETHSDCSIAMIWSSNFLFFVIIIIGTISNNTILNQMNLSTIFY